jgi:3-(3-hydroxy-phenyl)propionate hydroxylase
MCAATILAQEGVDVTLVEINPEPMPDWRASTFHAPTLELLDRIGIVERMHREGLVVPRYQFRDRKAGLVAEYDFSLLTDETKYPYRLQLNQQRLVEMLFEGLLQAPTASLVFGTQLVGLSSHEDGVTLTLKDVLSGVERQLEAAFVIGADGARSTTRNLLEVPFEGMTYLERFLITSTPVDMAELIPDLAPVNYIADPEEWLFILRTPESWRVLWPVPTDVESDVAMSDEEIERHLQGVAPRAEAYPILDRQIYSVHQRVAERFVTGRTLLMGDAAHINSPVGGVGLNSGIHDAFDAATRLSRILKDGADVAEELAAYEFYRRRVALEYVQADTDRNTKRLAERDPELRKRNIEEMRALAFDPDAQRNFLRRVSLLESFRRFGVGEPIGAAQ